MRKGSLAKGISPETRRWFCKSTACGGGERRVVSSVVCSPAVRSYFSESCLLKILTVVTSLYTYLSVLILRLHDYTVYRSILMQPLCASVGLWASCLLLSKSTIVRVLPPFWNKTFINIFRNMSTYLYFFPWPQPVIYKPNFKLCTREWDISFLSFVLWLCFWINWHPLPSGHSCRLTQLRDFSEGF